VAKKRWQRITTPTQRARAQAEAYAQWVPVKSSWIDAVRFNAERGTFDAMIHGVVYPDSPGMTKHRFAMLLHASSIGQWMWRNYPPRSHASK